MKRDERGIRRDDGKPGHTCDVECPNDCTSSIQQIGHVSSDGGTEGRSQRGSSFCSAEGFHQAG